MNIWWRPAVAFLVAIVGIVSAAPREKAQVPVAARGGAQTEILFVQAPVVAAGDLAGRFPQGSFIVRLGKGSQSKSPSNLTPEFFAAADPAVSFDGAKALFAVQKEANGRWQIWEMNVDGSGKRQVTQCSADCLRPAYLPRDLIAYTMVTGETGRKVSQVYVAKRDGSEAAPLTFGPGNFQLETVLRDGRILVSASSPLVSSKGRRASRDLYTIRIDGTALATFRCDHRQPAVRAQAAELEDGSVVFVKSAGAVGKVGGELAQIRRGALHNSALSPLRATYSSPQRLKQGKLIVSRQSLAAQSHPGKFDLYALDSVKGNFGELVYRDPELSSLQAVPVAAHPVPRWYWSTVNPKINAGYLICLDSYLSDGFPKGRIATPISRLRVFALDEATNQERTLGEAPVEKDGSFYVAVPPDRPVRFELVDASGKVIRAQRSWIWARPGEERGCVGCHEDKAVAPPNRWPEALRRLDTPTLLGGAQAPVLVH